MKKHLKIISIVVLAAILRLCALDKFPAGLNADEASIGYNAYSLLETGKDEHGVSWPLVFRSFDDYKPPLYFYLVLPFVKLLGLSVWAVRLPSAILGIASVYLIYLLTTQIFPQSKQLPFLSALFLAISPWHLHFSRGGWEVNAAAFFLMLGIWAFFKSLNHPKYYLIFTFSFLFSLYSYHSMRIIAPLTAIALFILYRTKIYLKPLILSLALGLMFALPLVKQMLSTEGRSRFSGVSVFADQGPLWEALERRRQSPNPNSIQTRLIHNKYLTYSRRFISNYLSHYSPRFLFITGDEIARSKVPGVGQSYLILAPFYLLGILNLLKLNTKGKKFILFWFLTAPLAAALTFQSPHALRSQNMVIPLTITTALGTYQFFIFFQKYKKIFATCNLLLIISIFYSTIHYLHQYYTHYPKELGFAWQYGFDQLGEYLKENGDQYTSTIISNRYDQPYIIMAFFLRYPPDKFQQEIKLEPRDKFGFSTVDNFGKYQFKQIDWPEDSKQKNTLIITTEEGVPAEVKPVHQVLFPNGQPAFKLYSTSNI